LKLLCLCGFAITAILVYWRTCGMQQWSMLRSRGWRRWRQMPLVSPEHYLGGMTFLFALLLFVLPVFNPWYMVWWLAFAVLRPTVTAWTCSVVLLLSYVTGINTGDTNLQLYQMPTWALWLEFGAVALALAVDLWRYQPGGLSVRSSL
ncbi:MAG: hypothetical protein AAF993_00195, partial [Pseudomonadota bacterium]